MSGDMKVKALHPYANVMGSMNNSPARNGMIEADETSSESGASSSSSDLGEDVYEQYVKSQVDAKKAAGHTTNGAENEAQQLLMKTLE
jgi:hypothetical protein